MAHDEMAQDEDEDDDGNSLRAIERIIQSITQDLSLSREEKKTDDWMKGLNIRRSPSRRQRTLEYRSVACRPICPRSYLFFIIAKVGPGPNNHSPSLSARAVAVAVARFPAVVVIFRP